MIFIICWTTLSALIAIFELSWRLYVRHSTISALFWSLMFFLFWPIMLIIRITVTDLATIIAPWKATWDSD